MSIGAAWGSGSWNGWADGTWGVSSSDTWGVWSRQTATDVSRQFVTIGNFPSGSNDVDFVLTADEAHPIYLSDDAQPFLLIQEVMEEP